MRVSAALVAYAMLPIAAAGSASPQSPANPGASEASHCSRTTSYLADTIGQYRGQRLMRRKLTELPPATAYMAVYRHIGDCEAPLTMVEYRNPRRH